MYRTDSKKAIHLPLDLTERRRKRIEEEVVARFRRGSEKGQTSDKFIIFVDAGVTKVIRKDFANCLLGWAKGKAKLKFQKRKSWDINALTG